MYIPEKETWIDTAASTVYGFQKRASVALDQSWLLSEHKASRA